MTAYVDESLRLEGAGLYVLAAVLVPDGRADAVRATLRDALRRGQRRLHWRDESADRRMELTSLVRGLDVCAVVVTASPVAPRESERARRRCLSRLLWECEQRAVSELVIESRRHRDRHDRELIAHARRSRWLMAEVRYAFAEPGDEPLLWLPDIVAGTVALTGRGQHEYLESLSTTVTVIEV